MKKMKRFLAMALALVMATAMMLPAGAVDITIKDHVSGTYTAYKILDVKGSKDAVRYTIDESSLWYPFVCSHFAVEDTSATIEYVTEPSGFDAAVVAANALKAIPGGAASVSGTGGTITLTPGYWLMKSPAGTNAFLFTVVDDGIVTALGTVKTEINEKAEFPKVEKVVSDSVVDITQGFTYTTTIKANTGAEKYVLHDLADDKIVIDVNSIQVKDKNNTPAVLGTNYTVTTSTDDGCDFHIEFTDAFVTDYKDGDEITVTYNAELKPDAAISAPLENETWLAYGSGQKTAEGTATVATYRFALNKVDANDDPLNGAKFTVSRGGTDLYFVKAGNVYTLSTNGTSGASTEIIAGTVTIAGLGDGTYTVTETQAPDGYIMSTTKPTVTITNSDGADVTIHNTPGSMLPETGGIGTTVFYVLGGSLMLGAAVIVLLKKREINR